MKILNILFYPFDQFKKMKPVQRLPIVIFLSVLLYYIVHIGVIDWYKVIGYTFIYWIWGILICLVSGLELFKS